MNSKTSNGTDITFMVYKWKFEILWVVASRKVTCSYGRTLQPTVVKNIFLERYSITIRTVKLILRKFWKCSTKYDNKLRKVRAIVVASRWNVSITLISNNATGLIWSVFFNCKLYSIFLTLRCSKSTYRINYTVVNIKESVSWELFLLVQVFQ